jgi:lipoic acid synthetase
MNNSTDTLRKPQWLKRKMAFQGKQAEVDRFIADFGLHTVCKEARCPNRGECFSRGTATFLVMGAVCTRHCAFCSVQKGQTAPLDWDEIARVVDAAKKMNLRHAVITSVTRDDLPDGGALFFAELVDAFRRSLPGVTVELLIPDLQGDVRALETVFASRPDVLNHNVETVPSLYATMRPQADYQRSLELIGHAAKYGLVAKSGIMVGLGETVKEVALVMDDLRRHNCTVLTIGQYLQPTGGQAPVQQYVTPEQFELYRNTGLEMGFTGILSGPFVRSSYRAAESIGKINSLS